MQGLEIGNGQMPKERKKKYFFHFLLKLYSLNQADNELNFIYSPKYKQKDTQPHKPAETIDIFGVHLPRQSPVTAFLIPVNAPS